MYKKVFEKKFPDSSSATKVLDSAGWQYLGRKGILKIFHLYEGVSIEWGGNVSEKHRVQLYSDGYVVLYNDSKLSGTLSTTGLPLRVWPSEDVYRHLKKCIDEYNEKLTNEYGHIYYIEDRGYRKYELYKLERKEGSIGETKVLPSLKIFETPREAFDWAVATVRNS